MKKEGPCDGACDGRCQSGLIVDAGSEALTAVPYCQTRAVIPVYVLEGVDQNSVSCLVMFSVFDHVEHGVKIVAAVVDIDQVF